MTEQMAQVCVYIFKNDDGRSTGQRLQEAAEHYCGVYAFEAAAVQNAALAASGRNLTDKLRVERTALGKPYFPNLPALHFSISHSGTYWACAMGDVNLGLDLQEHVIGKNETKEEAAARFRKMAHRFFHPAEAEFVEQDCFNRFFTVWSAREAYVKNTGQGIDKYFSEHCVVPRDRAVWEQLAGELPDNKTEVRACRQRSCSWTALGKWFRKTDVKENYSLCVCGDKEFDWMIYER